MTTREYQCVLLVTAGMDHKEVAARLGIQTSSVRGYLRSAADQVTGGSVQRLIATLRAEAFEESRKLLPGAANRRVPEG